MWKTINDVVENNKSQRHSEDRQGSQITSKNFPGSFNHFLVDSSRKDNMSLWLPCRFIALVAFFAERKPLQCGLDLIH